MVYLMSTMITTRSMKTLLFSAVLVTLLAGGTATAEQQYRSITSLNFNYYTDDRSSLAYEEVFIIPAPNQFYVITSVLGKASDFDASTGGKIGLAFDLPGFYYGETSYTYEHNFDDADKPNVSTLNGSVTYETGGIRASLGLTGEFSDESWGVTLSPGINYLATPVWELYIKYFSAYNRYSSDQYFNHAVWTGTEYEVLPTVWLHLGGTFGTVYEPDNSYEKWSVITGVKVLPVEGLTVRYQFEYTANPYYDIISNGIVADYKF